MDIPPQRSIPAATTNKKHKRSGSIKTRQHPPPPQIQRSFSSSEEDLKSTPEYGSDEPDSEKGTFFQFKKLYVCDRIFFLLPKNARNLTMLLLPLYYICICIVCR